MGCALHEASSQVQSLLPTAGGSGESVVRSPAEWVARAHVSTSGRERTTDVVLVGGLGANGLSSRTLPLDQGRGWRRAAMSDFPGGVDVTAPARVSALCGQLGL